MEPYYLASYLCYEERRLTVVPSLQKQNGSQSFQLCSSAFSPLLNAVVLASVIKHIP